MGTISMNLSAFTWPGRAAGRRCATAAGMALLAIVIVQLGGLLATARAEAPHDIVLPAPDQVGPDVLLGAPDLPTAPPPNPQVGDSWVWWLWVHAPMPPHFEQRVCTVRGKSDHAYVVVENTQWGVNITQANVDAILERWENTTIGPYADEGIYAINSQIFGQPPDELDNDPRVYLMWFNFGISSDGFFFYFDEYPEGTFPGYHSNECETLYLNCGHGQSPQGDYMLSVVAHEFEHMIHWKYDEGEDSWVDEGLAELAMWFYGRPDVISAFNTNPDNSLIVWSGNWADYIKTYLWSLYFYERYGGEPAVFDVVHEPANSIAGYEAVLDGLGYTENFADVFADWTVANFLDNSTIGDGRFGDVGAVLPAFSVAGTSTSYPVPATTRTVNYWAADYYRFRTFGATPAIEWSFNGSDNNVFAVWCLVQRGTGTTSVLRMTLNPATQTGSLPVGGLTHPDDQVILVVASTSSAGSSSYVFSAQSAPAGLTEEEPFAGGSAAGLLRAWPNPAANEVRLAFADQPASAIAPAIEIYDAGGRLVRRLAGAASGASVRWDGRDGSGVLLAPGLYYARARVGGEVVRSPITLLR